MSALADLIRREIADEGPMGVDRYMALALGHPTLGYYATRDPFGAAGDFTTAPEISQMFGELVGVWAAETWTAMGRPDPVRLIELGPGRGTLMADALRAARVLPAFRAALDVTLVETSRPLRERQGAALESAGAPLRWVRRLEDAPPGPAIVVANEFFDALPIRQFVAGADGWRERLVGLDSEGALRFGLAATQQPGMRAPARAGDVLEIATAGLGVMRTLSERLVREGGAALAIDYGHAETGFGDTLQAVRAHAFADPLAEPGEADLTAHVDFGALAREARDAGAAVHGPMPQARFLFGLGLVARAEALASRGAPDAAQAVESAARRLTEGGRRGMGVLFKALAVTAPGLPAPAPFPGYAPLTGHPA